MTRSEHLQWAKTRALEYVEQGDNAQAFASFTSDLMKHDDLRASINLQATLGVQLLAAGHLSTKEKMCEWINGFN